VLTPHHYLHASYFAFPVKCLGIALLSSFTLNVRGTSNEQYVSIAPLNQLAFA